MEAFATLNHAVRSPRGVSYDPGLPTAAVILDDFSYQCFDGALNQYRLVPKNATLDVEIIRPDFLLVESAWNGNNGVWRYMVTSSSRPKPPLVRLIERCRQLDIPTVFWNKEDPPHYSQFISTAKYFDYVFTTDADMIPRYHDDIPGAHVDLLRFAASRRIHTPERVTDYRDRDVAFGGQYFRHKFLERRKQMDTLFPIAAQYDFAIYSRALGGDPNYQFPSRYQKYVEGSLPYEQMVEQYRRFKVFLNVNSVTRSKTMCARRVYELSASKTITIGTASEAIRSVYPSDEVLLSDSADVLQEYFANAIGNPAYRREVTQNAWRRTLASHTYHHRVQQIVATISETSASVREYLIWVDVSHLSDDVIRRTINELGNQDDSHIAGLSFVIFEAGARVRTASLLRECAAKYPNIRVAHEQPQHVDYVLHPAPAVSMGRFYVTDMILALEQSGASYVSCATGADDTESMVEGAPPSHTSWLRRYVSNGPESYSTPSTYLTDTPEAIFAS